MKCIYIFHPFQKKIGQQKWIYLVQMFNLIQQFFLTFFYLYFETDGVYHYRGNAKLAYFAEGKSLLTQKNIVINKTLTTLIFFR
jgi:hypothetical protein